MSKNYARINRLYSVMVELLNLPKTIDVMRKMPAYVKGGEVFDFNDRSFGDTDKPDGDIFKGIERVKKTQAVTAALKRDYTAALKLWLDGEQVEEPKDEPTMEKPTKAEKKAAKKAAAKAAAIEEVEPNAVEDDAGFDLVAEVKKLLKAGELKAAKKMIKKYAAEFGEVDAKLVKKAKKLYKTATE